MNLSKITISESMKKRLIKNKEGRLSPFLSYFTSQNNELIKVTVALKTTKKETLISIVVIESITGITFVSGKLRFSCVGGYHVDWKDKDEEMYVPNISFHNLSSKIINPEFIKKLPHFKYSAAELYPYRESLFEYLKIWEEYPEAEYLVKMDLSSLAMKKTILKELRKKKSFAKYLYKNRNEIQIGLQRTADPSTILTAYRKNTSLKDEKEKTKKIKYVSTFIEKNVLKNYFAKNDQKYKLALYLEKQKLSATIYNDYIRACIKLGLDLTQNKNLIPHDLKYWHDVRINQYEEQLERERLEKEEKQKEEERTLKTRFIATSQKYNLLNLTRDAYSVLIATDPEELVKEGAALHHCVGVMGYAAKFAKEDSIIFFIRKTSDIDTAYVTMEYSVKQKRILQIYGAYNSKPNEETINFINQTWLPYAKQIKSF